MNLITRLTNQINTQKGIPFVEFMQLALYEPNLGYYTSSLPKIGKQGDFITAPEMTPLFSYTLANQCQPILAQLPEPTILEFGAGSGRLCVDLLTRLENLNCLPERYFILDVSGDLQQRQRSLIEQETPHLLPIIHWLTRWPETAFNGVIIANEVLDAMPVHRFVKNQGQFYECFVEIDKDNHFFQSLRGCKDSALLTYLQTHFSMLDEPYQSEVNLFIQPWLKQCSDILAKGAMFIIDYGFPRHEYYHPDRTQGTLMCHYQHHAHANPFIHIGEQDLTAHVDFTHVAESAYDAGFEINGYTNQAAFLLSNGLLNLLDEIDEPSRRINAHQAIKVLTHPSEMGELFKVIALTKHLNYSLTGFEIHDKRATL